MPDCGSGTRVGGGDATANNTHKSSTVMKLTFCRRDVDNKQVKG